MKKNRFIESFKQYIKKTVESTYQSYGYHGEAKIELAFQKYITISLDMEDPYMGEKFWDFLGKMGENLEPTLKLTGYLHKSTKYVGNFCIVEYAFFVNNNEQK